MLTLSPRAYPSTIAWRRARFWRPVERLAIAPWRGPSLSVCTECRAQPWHRVGANSKRAIGTRPKTQRGAHREQGADPSSSEDADRVISLV